MTAANGDCAGVVEGDAIRGEGVAFVEAAVGLGRTADGEPLATGREHALTTRRASKTAAIALRPPLIAQSVTTIAETPV
jgi:hypothetical protein